MASNTQPDPVELDLNAPDTLTLLGGLLRQALYSGKLALLFGSAISQFRPANIPTASYISEQLRDIIADRFSLYASRDDILWGIARMPFEIFMSRLAEFVGSNAAEEFVRELTAIRQSNPVHLQIGALVDMCISQGVELAVVTTNYDLGIELASVSKLVRIVEETDIDRTRSNPVCLFKPHGSIDVKGSLVFDSEREHGLPQWKRDFLRSLLAGKTLVILGYSGWDLDISLALNDCGLDAVIWCCYQEQDAEIEQWSPGARQLITEPGYKYKLILNASKKKTRQRNILKVLEPVSPGFVHVQRSQRAIHARLVTALKSMPPDVQGAWLAWTITRAGYGRIGIAAKHLVDQVPTIPRAKRLRYEANCYFYQGRHATAARLGRAAASASGSDIVERTYHRADEAGYWNRGHYSIMTMIAIGRGLLESCLLLFQSDKRGQFASAATYVLDQASQIWPLQWLIGSHIGRKIATLLMRYGKQARRFEEQVISDRLAHVGSGDAGEELTKWRYEWLGQKARLINYQRIESRIALNEFRQHRRLADFHRGLQLALNSALGASRVGDPARLGKACLLLAELAFEAHATKLSFQATLLQQLGVCGSSWEEIAHSFAHKGWQEIQTSEAWFLSTLPGIWLYSLATGALKRMFGKNISRFLVSAAFRWAGT